MSSSCMDTMAAECFSHFEQTVLHLQGYQSPEELDNKIAAFESFQRAMNDKMTAEVTRLKRYRNGTSLIYKLPNELLLKILLLSVDLFDWKLEEIGSIALVSTLWHDVIHTNHIFWPELCQRYPLKVIDIVVQRNPRGPLRIRCEEGDASAELSRMEQFMAIALQHAHRWETLFFYGPLSKTLQKYLCTPTPLLRDIFVDQSSEGEFKGALTFSEGASLRHLDLDYITTIWDANRLSGLKTIQLRNLYHDIPSISQLHAILSASPELEWLSIVYVRGEEDASLEASLRSIHLPHLTTLQISDISVHLSRFLLSNIHAPSCRSLTAVGLYSGSLPDGIATLQFYQTLSAAVQSSNSACVTYDYEEGIKLQSNPSPQVTNEWIHYVEDPVGFDVTIPFSQEETIWEQTANLLTRVSIPCVPTSLVFGLLPVAGLRSELPEGDQIYRQLVVPWKSAVSLSICDDRLLQYLIEQQPNVDGCFEWLCPKLRSLRVSMPCVAEELAKRVVAFATRRYGGDDDELYVIARPEPLERLEVPAAAASLIRKEAVFRNVDVIDLEAHDNI